MKRYLWNSIAIYRGRWELETYFAKITYNANKNFKYTMQVNLNEHGAEQIKID